ncbi:MAG: tetratricopeptide repeat protein [Candidatus Heimdallarchaeaceae archaeon]
MSPTIENQLKNIEQLIIIGDFKKGLEVIEKNLKRKDTNEEDQLRLLNFKGYIQNRLGNHKEAFEIAKSVSMKKKEEKLSLTYLDALILETISSFLLNKVKQSLILIEDCFQVITKISNVDQKELAKRKSHIYGIKGTQAGTLGDYTKGIENLQLAIKYAKETDYKDREAFYSSQLAMTLYYQNKLEEAEEILEKALELAQSINNKHEIAFAYNRYGALKSARFNYNDALEYFFKSESLLKELGSTFLFSALYVNIADVYLSRYQLDEALEYAKKALEFGFLEYLMYGLIGEIYLWKNEFEKAEETLLKAMKLSIKAADIRIIPKILYSLVILAVERKEETKAQDYLKQLEDLAKKREYEYLEGYYNFALTIYYKSSSDIDDWGKAKRILKELLKDKKLPDYLRTDALFSLLEIRLMELQITASKETLEQVLQQILELQNEAEDKRLYWVLVELYYLRSQVALLELNVKKSLELLTTASIIAEDKGLKFLVQKIKKEQEKVESQIEMWNRFQEQNTPLTETLKEIKLENTRKDIVRETIMEVRDENTGQIKEYRKLFSIKI